MTQIAPTRSKTRRLAAVVAAFALAGLLGGCVVYPAGGYYYGNRGYYGGGYGGGYYAPYHRMDWDHDGWR